jgi:predicted DNA-binding WGR domain protein
MRYSGGMKIIYLLKIDSDANEYRFYRLALPPDGRVVHKLWGRVHEHGTEHWDDQLTPAAALKEFNRTLREKKTEGYVEADEKVLPKNWHIYMPKPAEAVERPADGQLSWIDPG